VVGKLVWADADLVLRIGDLVTEVVQPFGEDLRDRRVTNPVACSTSMTLTVAGLVIPRSRTLHDLVAEHVVASARLGSEAYAMPTRADVRSMATAVRLAEADRFTAAARRLEPLGYAIVRLPSSDGRHLVLLEGSLRQDRTPPRNWGLYVLDLQSATDLLVEVPHPLHDIDSHRVGVELFQQVQGRALLVAGAHRYANADGSADVARARMSVFDSVHATLLRPGTIVVQPHGFARERHEGVGDIVVSGGTWPPPPIVAALAETLRPVAEVCVYEGNRGRDLAGTTNIQGRTTRALGATFIHVELARSVRRDAARRQPVVRRMAAHLADAR
jgi:hypothetical protein